MNRRIFGDNVQRKGAEKIQNCGEKKNSENQNTTNVVLVSVCSVSIEKMYPITYRVLDPGELIIRDMPAMKSTGRYSPECVTVFGDHSISGI